MLIQNKLYNYIIKQLNFKWNNIANGVSEAGRETAADGEGFLAVCDGGDTRLSDGDRLEVDISQAEIRTVAVYPTIHFGVAFCQTFGEIQRSGRERPSSFRWTASIGRFFIATSLDGWR